jgi:predicted glycosyltransferase
LYLGPWGLDIDWQALEQIDGWTFLTHDPPAAHPANVRALDRRDWPFADTAASVDAVISKAGYGTVTECIANDVPLIYVPRRAFAEYDALVAGMAPWNGGIPISDTEFRAGHWQKALQTSQVQPRNPHAYAVNGSEVVAAALKKMLVV